MNFVGGLLKLGRYSGHCMEPISSSVPYLCFLLLSLPDIGLAAPMRFVSSLAVVPQPKPRICFNSPRFLVSRIECDIELDVEGRIENVILLSEMRVSLIEGCQYSFRKDMIETARC